MATKKDAHKALIQQKICTWVAYLAVIEDTCPKAVFLGSRHKIFFPEPKKSGSELISFRIELMSAGKIIGMLCANLIRFETRVMMFKTELMRFNKKPIKPEANFISLK